MKKYILITIISFLFILTIFSSPRLVSADTTPKTHDNEIKEKLITSGTSFGGYQTADGNTLVSTIANIVKIVIGLLSFIFFALILISGIQWLTAGGDANAVKTAKERMKNATIGLAIALLSFTISYYIFSLIRMTQDNSVSVPF